MKFRKLLFVLPIVVFVTIASLGLVLGIVWLVAVAAGLSAVLALFLLTRPRPAPHEPRAASRAVTLVMPAEVPQAQIFPDAAQVKVVITPMVSITHSDSAAMPPAPRTRARPRPKTLVGLGADLVEFARARTSAPPPPPEPPPDPVRSREPDPALLDLYPVPTSWQPDGSLIPAKRKALANQLLARAISRCFVVAIFGTPETASRKSRVASELALALSASGQPRTLLVDANLQQPRLHHLFRVSMPASCGFSQQLSARIRGNARLTWGVVVCRNNLHALVEGMVLSPGVVLSTHFEACIRELRSYYDLIVIDGPFSSQRSDYNAVEAVVDGMLRLEGAHSSPSASPRLFSRDL